MAPTLESSTVVAGYVQAVRAELDDLPAETVEELTGGLDADLQEALAADGQFAPPETYAAELRSAAGLGERRAAPVARSLSWGLVREFSHSIDSVREDVRHQFATALAGQSWWPSVRDFARALHPTWWSVRAYLAYWYLAQLGDSSQWEPAVPQTLFHWLALAALLVLSIELGRRRWPGLIAAALVVLNVWLVVAVLMVTPAGLY